MDKRAVAVLVSLFLVITTAAMAIIFARGYRPDFKTRTMEPTGILVATSDPDGAEVFIDGKLTTATNTTINLAPGNYDIRLSRDGYTDWQKKVTIKKEEVYKTNAFLFPKAPDLRPLTFNGSGLPTISPDQTRIVYTVASASATGNGIWIADMTGRPLIGGVDFRQIFRDNLYFSLVSNITGFTWSFDNRQLVASTSGGLYYLFDTDRINDGPQTISNTQWDSFLAVSAQQKQQKLAAQLAKLDANLLPLIASTSASPLFSPDESKVLYLATASAIMPKIINQYIPGTDPTPEDRNLQPGNIYVYDIKEDRNYLIDSVRRSADSVQKTDPLRLYALRSTLNTISWFPTSRHLLAHNDKEIWLTEYDGSNKAVVYAGPFIDNVVFSWPNVGKILILTTLNSPSGVGENLYTINLR